MSAAAAPRCEGSVVITEPGVYEMPSDEYHAHPALSSSGARKLLSPSCPARFAWEREHGQGHKRVFDVGHAAHRLVLGAGPDLAVIVASDWRTKAAQEARDAARDGGKVPLLEHEYDTVKAMEAALRAHPVAEMLRPPGKPEQSMFAKDASSGVMLRARVDWLPYETDGRMTLVDYKTTVSAEPGTFARSVARYGYHQQAAWYVDIVRAVLGIDDVEFVFVGQEKTAPYIVQAFQLDDYSLEVGRKRNRKAIDLFAECTERDDWPTYAQGVETLTVPVWADDDEEIVIS